MSKPYLTAGPLIHTGSSLDMSVGLTVFIVVLALDLLGLLGDYLLSSYGLPAISAIARQHLLVGAGLVFLQLLGAAGLALHFWG